MSDSPRDVRLGSNGFGPWAEAQGRAELIRGYLAFRGALHDEPFERGLRRSPSDPQLHLSRSQGTFRLHSA